MNFIGTSPWLDFKVLKQATGIPLVDPAGVSL
jgi:hypothetical protein